MYNIKIYRLRTWLDFWFLDSLVIIRLRIWHSSFLWFEFHWMIAGCCLLLDSLNCMTIILWLRKIQSSQSVGFLRRLEVSSFWLVCNLRPPFSGSCRLHFGFVENSNPTFIGFFFRRPVEVESSSVCVGGIQASSTFGRTEIFLVIVKNCAR